MDHRRRADRSADFDRPALDETGHVLRCDDPVVGRPVAGQIVSKERPVAVIEEGVAGTGRANRRRVLTSDRERTPGGKSGRAEDRAPGCAQIELSVDHAPPAATPTAFWASTGEHTSPPGSGDAGNRGTQESGVLAVPASRLNQFQCGSAEAHRRTNDEKRIQGMQCRDPSLVNCGQDDLHDIDDDYRNRVTDQLPADPAESARMGSR